MKSLPVHTKPIFKSNKDRNAKRLGNALARRRLQELHDEKVLRSWLAEVWDQSTWSDQFDAGRRFH